MGKLILVLTLALLGCAKGSDTASSASSTPSSKGLFNSWTSDTTGAVIDLSDAIIGTSTMTFVFAGGEKCGCILDIVGAQASGNYVFSSCTYLTGTGTSLMDPGCSGLNQSGTYTVTSSVLRACSGATCGTYH